MCARAEFRHNRAYRDIVPMPPDTSLPVHRANMLKRRLRQWLPDPHRVREHRLLRHLGPALHHPRLWHLSRHGIALGLAIGVFFGLLIPIAQIPFAAILAVSLRANLPVAMASTLVTNPITFAPIYYAAYKLGAFLLGENPAGVSEADLGTDAQTLGAWFAFWMERIATLGQPLILGLVILASTLAVTAYFVANGLWRAWIIWSWRQRAQRRLPR